MARAADDAGTLRRAARSGRVADRDRRAAADHQLVLPQGLLDRLDGELPPPEEAHDRRRGGQWLGMILLGFTSIYREGFETVLFLQALVLDSGTATVLGGVALGSGGTRCSACWSSRFRPSCRTRRC